MGNLNSSEGGDLRFLDKCPELPPAPPEDQVQLNFDALLLSLCADPELREELNAIESIETKWAYTFLSKISQDNVAEEWLDPRECVGLISQFRSNPECVHKLFLAIRINVILRPVAWVEKFVSEGGIEELLTPLQTRGGTSVETCNEVLNTLFVFTNNSSGLTAIVSCPDCCSQLYSLFDLSPSNVIKARSLKLLRVLCRESTMAQDAIMEVFSSKSPEERTVQTLVAKVEQNQLDLALQLAVVKFVNTLLETTRDRKQRVSICDDLKSNGYLNLLEPFKSQDDSMEADASVTSLMIEQVNVFFEYCNEATNQDNFGVFRLALGDALTINRSNFGMDTTGNQGENDGQVRQHKLEKLEDTNTNTSIVDKSDKHSLSKILSDLQLHTNNMSQETSEKLTSLLGKLALTLSDQTGATQAVERLEKSLLLSQNPEQAESQGGTKALDHVHVQEAKPVQEPDLLTRVSLALFPSLSDQSASVIHPPSSGRPPLFSGFGDFSLLSLTSATPAKSSILRPSFSSFIGADSAASSWGRSTNTTGEKGVKMSLPFFQSSRKGPGLGVTPACTPIATASVKKDTKRPVFPSFPSPPKKKVGASAPPPPRSLSSLQPAAVSLPDPAPILPMIDIPSPLASLEIVKPLLIEPNENKDSNTVKSLSIGTDISKFRKLLSMGAPREAVRAKMKQAGVNPDLLDEVQGFTPKGSPMPSPSVKKPAFEVTKEAASGIDTSGPDIFKFKKLHSMGAPLGAVKAKMIQAGLDPVLLDSSSSPSPATNSEAPQLPQLVKVIDDPQYAKFFKLRSMGAPAESVKAKMRMAGLQSELLDTPDAVLKPESSGNDSGSSQTGTKVKDDPAYAKFFKLLSMGAPPESVKAKMHMAGLQPELLDTPDAAVPAANEPATAIKATVKVKDDPNYAKFFKLLSMGAPAESVKVKMQMAGLKSELLDTPDADLPSNNAQPSQLQVKAKDDPSYAKFFKLLEMGAPAESVKAKMRMAGLQADFLDTPDAILPTSPSVNKPAEPAPTTNAARRAHLSIAIKPAATTKTRAFYWQHLKAEAIQGTIWEELEKEHSNQSNEDLLTLTEKELELLETEFPPPSACGPSTGSRRGNMMLSPGPASPVTSPRVVFLIDRARSNNISIIVKQFRMSNATLRVAIMKMDSEVLTLDRVQGLIKMLPTEDEIAAITGFNGDPTTLNGAELVLKELITVPRLKQRLAALETKHQFPALVRDLQTKINKIRVASNEIAQSSEFKTILLVILQVGNKMNNGTSRGGAKGFRLNDLTKLVQLKSVEKSVTLLHYVARMIRLKKGNVIRLGDSLASLYDVQSIPIPELQGDMNRINDLTENINVELAAQRLKNRIEEKEESDLFVESMTVFVDEATKEVASLKTELDETFRLMRDIMLRFDKNNEDDGALLPSADAPLTSATLSGAGEFFSIIYEFTMSLTKADRENEIKRIRDEKRLKQQELKIAAPRSVLKKVPGPETQETPQRKNMMLSETPNNPAMVDVKAEIEPATAQSSDQETSKLEQLLPATVPKLPQNEEKSVSKPSGIPKPKLKLPGHIIRESSQLGSVSPLKKISTSIPSPTKLQRTNLTLTSPEKTEVTLSFDGSSIKEIKSQLEIKHTTNNVLPVVRVLKPEFEAERDDHDNNNSEPSSPEKALSEVEPSTHVAILS